MVTIKALLNTILVASTALIFSPGGALANAFDILIGKGPKSALSEAGISSIAATMNAIFRGDRYTGVNCELSFSLSGELDLQIPDSVDTREQLQALLSRSDTNVIVVRYLNYCGKYNPSYSGCSDDDLPIVVENQIGTASALATQTNAVLWLHEFGHSQKLSHNLSASNLMADTVGPLNLKISSAQCANLRRKNTSFKSPPSAAPQDPIPTQSLLVEGLSELEKVLLGPWVHGIPVDDLQESQSDLTEIRKILLDAERSELWPNGVIALGITGKENDIDFLIWYFQNLFDFKENISAETAQTNVPFAIGLLSGRHNSTRGLSFLSSLVADVDAVQLEGTSAVMDEASAAQVSKNALVGIALSPAFDQGAAASDGENPLAAQVKELGLPQDFADELQELARESRSQGIQEYFSAPALR